MNKQDHSLGFHTPKQPLCKATSNPMLSNKQNRYINSLKLECVPGFDLGTPHKSETSENCQIYKALKLQESYPSFNSISLNINYDQQVNRSFPTQAEKILDAPDIVDDYYLNLISWSDKNILAVALRNRLYLWNGNTNYVDILSEYRNDIITSVSWMQGGRCLAIGDSAHNIKLIDVEKNSEIRTIQAHSDRVSSLAWNGYVLSSGSRDSLIINHDLRIQNYFVKYTSHNQEICGLKWNTENNYLASGANDNKICIWDLSSTMPIYEFKEHKAAVKALAWCPWKRNLLASGGGSIDKMIKMWDCTLGNCVSSVDTGSQVSALEWNRYDKEILSAHGYTQNQLTLWKADEMTKIMDFNGHTARILNMSANPDGTQVVTAGADETLRFWNIFNSMDKPSEKICRWSPGSGINAGYR
ncbi:hypothetical protein SteCoe_31191 [Stentor coeruleus]|uniref:CDC20/Fizzy WD40 domain-containing protein n=1 Tax=Stentor coeruleus TaxID=5963 RepID=A0A1R2B2B9_9CILI|nr:hypothetical protein SteCoe_31191 [Stentor coeruleus]